MPALLSNPVRRILNLSGRVVRAALRRGVRGRETLAGPITRPRFLAQIHGDVLEIGPFDVPALRGANIAFFDVLDQAGLAARALEHGRNPETCPEIAFVSPVGDLAVVDRQFDAVFSSHAIEHQPDLIAHLNGVERILKPGGYYYLIVPDKRFCFDHFSPESRLADVVAAHERRQIIHNADAIRFHWLKRTHNDALLHWLGFHGSIGSADFSPERAVSDVQRAEVGEYVDVHSWRFTSAGFGAIIDELNDLGLTAFRPKIVHDTMFGQLEFFAILTLDRSQSPAPFCQPPGAGSAR